MLTAQNLIYNYEMKTALHNINFKIPKGDITALVGPNGAGKSTLMRCMAGIDMPFSGTILIDNIDPYENPREARQKIGYLPDDFGLFNDLSIRDNIIYAALMHQIPLKQAHYKAEKIEEFLNLSNKKNAPTASLSRGYRQRVAIAQSIIHDPEILILDEPTSGLAPEARIELANIFKMLQQQGMTLIVSSHILAELEDYCTSMLVLRNGKLVSHETYKDKNGSDKAIEKILHVHFMPHSTLPPEDFFKNLHSQKRSKLKRILLPQNFMARNKINIFC